MSEDQFKGLLQTVNFAIGDLLYLILYPNSIVLLETNLEELRTREKEGPHLTRVLYCHTKLFSGAKKALNIK